MKNYVFSLHVQRILRMEEETVPDIVTKNESSFISFSSLAFPLQDPYIHLSEPPSVKLSIRMG
jgi:hypothetical protein